MGSLKPGAYDTGYEQDRRIYRTESGQYITAQKHLKNHRVNVVTQCLGIGTMFALTSITNITTVCYSL